MQQIARARIVSSFIVFILLISSLFIVIFFQSRQIIHGERFSIECDSKYAIRMPENAPLGLFNVTFNETQDSLSYMFSYQREFDSSYAFQNLSFRLETEYILGNGFYSVNASLVFRLSTSDSGMLWQHTIATTPGALVLGTILDNSSYSYEVSAHEKQFVSISWRFNLTSDIVPKQTFLSRLLVHYIIEETNEGISNTMTTSILLLSWVIGIVIIFEMIRRERIGTHDEMS